MNDRQQKTTATGAILLERWPIHAQQSVIVGVLATVMFLLALAIGLSASGLHIRLALRRRREWLDRTNRDEQLCAFVFDRFGTSRATRNVHAKRCPV